LDEKNNNGYIYGKDDNHHGATQRVKSMKT